MPTRRIKSLGELSVGLLEESKSAVIATDSPVSIISEDRVTQVARSAYKIIKHSGDVSIYYCRKCQESFKVPDDDDMYRFCPYCGLAISEINQIDDLI